MPDPIRLAVHKGISTLLEGVYFTDFDGVVYGMAGRVHRGIAVFGTETPVPLLSILESPIPEDLDIPPRTGTVFKGNWNVVIQGFCRDNEDNPTDPAHLMMAEVKRVLAKERKKVGEKGAAGPFGLGRLIDDLYIGPGVVRPPDDLSDKAYFWLTITIRLIEDQEDPYSY